MKKWNDYIRLFWYFASRWNPTLAAFIVIHEIRGEKKYGINTSSPVELSHLTIQNGDATHASRYEAINYYILEALLNKLCQITGDRSFTDLGCGKGRAMAVAAHYGFKTIRGIDFAMEMCRIAEQQMRKTVNRIPGINYKIYCQNVLNYDIHPEETVFFLFNPFDEEVLSAFLEKVNQSREEHPRTIYFLYASPRYIDVFFEYEYEPVFRKRKLKWLDGVILKREMEV
ncbi:MAG: class I SAM-dependent methyltransferase [Chitinophagaceae bacterium]|nr:class I SAM-dependent methyltransferase [Chitinophagaceae bacterium]